MALVKMVRDGQITLPASVREALKVQDGDYLEAEVLEGGEVRLRPAVVAERAAAWKRVIEIVDKDKWIGPEPRPSPDDEEQWIYDAVSDLRDRRG